MTADEAIGEDIHEIFLQLTGLTRVPRLRKLLHAPFSLHQALLAKIDRECRPRERRQACAHHCQAQRAHRADHHSGALPGFARRRQHRPHRARRVLPAARRARRVGSHPGAFHRRPLS